ncbi:serine hydrolase [Ochrobactrum sp. SFR4]|uniref:serine hydrolase n=1 Tax=Ochrobactrum sp. SFR4 TaxID=2717368 RepID=UPI003369BF6A
MLSSQLTLFCLKGADVGQAADINNPYTGYGSEGLFKWLAAYRLNRPVGVDFSYSNAGTALLGQVITHVDGRSYAQMVQEEIFDPLDMKQSVLALTTHAQPDMATGHGRDGEPVSHWDFDAFAPAGALITSASDLAKFIAAASGQTETTLKPAFALLTEHTRSVGGKAQKIGLGLIVTKLPHSTIVWHNGRTGGFESFAGFDRDNGNGVIVLSNRQSITGIDDIGVHLLDTKQKLLPQPAIRTAIVIDTAKLPIYVGQYLLAPGAIMSITEEKGQLFLQLTGQQRFAAFPESDTKFFLREVDAQISFTVEDGKATKLTLHQNGRNMPALRVLD